MRGKVRLHPNTLTCSFLLRITWWWMRSSLAQHHPKTAASAQKGFTQGLSTVRDLQIARFASSFLPIQHSDRSRKMAAQAMIRTSWGMLFMLFISILISQAGAKSDTQAVNHTQDSPQLFPAVVPIGINIPEGNPDFPDRQATFAKIVRGIKDAVAMARIACLFINEEAEEYKRYFEPGHADFVKCMSVL